MMPEHKQYIRRILIVSVMITIIFAIILNESTNYSLGTEEGFSAWIIRDEMRDPETIRDSIRFIRDSLLNTFKHVRDDAQLPLYYLLLDIWALLSGDSEFSLRLPSALMGMISLASVYAIGRQYFNTKTGLIALLLFGTSGFYLYYTREAQLYSLYLALSIISTWAYSRLWHKASIFRGAIYVIFLAFLIFTHHTAFVILLIHGLHALLTNHVWSKKSKAWQGFLLLMLWIVVPVIALFVIDMMGLSLFRLEYLLLIIPAGALFIANLISNMRSSFLDTPRRQLALIVIFTGLIISAQFRTYHVQSQARPDWHEAVSNADESRAVGESALVNFDADSPLAYYAHRTGLLDGISINIAWRRFSSQEIPHIADSLESASTVWSIVNLQDANSWGAIATLSENRNITYRDILEETIFYEFSEEAGETLSFTFGTDRDNRLLAYRGEFYRRYRADVGEEICVPIRLETLADIPEGYVIGLQTSYDMRSYVKTLEAYTRGDMIEEEFCFNREYESDIHLRLHIYDTQTSTHLDVMEDNFVWGQYLVRGVIEQASD